MHAMPVVIEGVLVGIRLDRVTFGTSDDSRCDRRMSGQAFLGPLAHGRRGDPRGDPQEQGRQDEEKGLAHRSYPPSGKIWTTFGRCDGLFFC